LWGQQLVNFTIMPDPVPNLPVADPYPTLLDQLCKKYSIPPPSVAKGSFERTLFPLILLRKINGNSVRSKYYLVASAAKGQPPAFSPNPRQNITTN